MSKRKTSTLGDLAAGADHGRRVVMSCGQLDGPFLAALARVRIQPALGSDPGCDAPTASWGEGVDQVKGADDATSHRLP